MKKIPILLCVVFLLTAAVPVGSVQAQWLKNGKPFDSNYAKTNGKLGGRMVFVDDNEQLYREWEQPTEGVSLHEVDTITPNKKISCFIVFSNATPDKKAMANVTVKYIVSNPLGTIVQQSPELEVWQNKPAPEENDLQLSVEFLQIVLNAKSPLGIYTVNAIVYDAVGDLRLELEKKFKLVNQ